MRYSTRVSVCIEACLSTSTLAGLRGSDTNVSTAHTHTYAHRSQNYKHTVGSNTPDPAAMLTVQPMGLCLHLERKGCDDSLIKALEIKTVYEIFLFCFFNSSILNIAKRSCPGTFSRPSSLAQTI